jgi:hypothetical protein
MELRDSDQLYLLLVNGKELGHIAESKRKALVNLFSMPSLTLEAIFLLRSLREKISRVTHRKEAVAPVDINIYGPSSQAMEVGDILSQHKIWLQKPDYCLKSLPYVNPHKIHFPELDGMRGEEILPQSMPGADHTAKEGIQQLEQEVLAASHRMPHQKGVAGDRRLKTILLP